MTTDTTRDRKVRMARRALWFLFFGLLACLGASVYKPEAAAALIGCYTPFCVGVAGVLAFFANANARVHEAQAGAPAQPGGTP
jgi:hypothetical protein